MFLPLEEDKRKIIKACLSSLQLVLTELLLSGHQRCSITKDLAEGHVREETSKYLQKMSSSKSQIKGR